MPQHDRSGRATAHDARPRRRRASRSTLALEQRPEVIAQNFELQGRNLTARIQENQLLPRVDLVGNFGLNGLSGDPVPVEVDGELVTTPFTGSYGKALDRMTSTDFYSFQAGVELEIPIGNAAAKAQYAQARIDVASSRAESPPAARPTSRSRSPRPSTTC